MSAMRNPHPKSNASHRFGAAFRVSRRLVAFVIAALMLPSTAGDAATTIGVAERIVRNVYGDDINRRMKIGEQLIANQRILTGRESAASLTFQDQTHLAIGPGSELRLDKFVYDTERKITGGTLSLAKGLLRFASKRKAVDLRVTTPAAVIGVRGTVFDVLAGRRQTEVRVHEGSVEVTNESGTRTATAGEVVRVRDGAPPSALPAASPALRAAVG